MVPPNTWKHIAATINCVSKKTTTVTLFVDGVKVKEDKIASPEREPLEENDQILIGGVNTLARITEVRYWASARSEDDIRDFYKSYLNLAETKGKMKGMVIREAGAGEGFARRRGRRAEKVEPVVEEKKEKKEDVVKVEEEDISLKMEEINDQLEEAEEEVEEVRVELKHVIRKPIKRRMHKVEDENTRRE